MLKEGVQAAVVLCCFALPTDRAQRADDVSPDWRGQWGGLGSGHWDPTTPPGLGQHAPLAPGYEAAFERGLADQERGGQGTDPAISAARTACRKA